MNALRIAGIAGTLTLALSAVAGAATIRLVPLGAETISATLNTCSAAASVVAAPAVIPPIAAAQHATGVTALRVTLDPHGALTGASVLASSGNPWLDRAAVSTARLSRFTPELRDCERVGGEYALLVDFTG
ncbi:MAG TPA: energy transducer TonB [Candidatus Elarobacter sp.]|jgi:TonB family protein|nr:energy transducer TonB [Candidatus Elarobacter sp.]